MTSDSDITAACEVLTVAKALDGSTRERAIALALNILGVREDRPAIYQAAPDAAPAATPSAPPPKAPTTVRAMPKAAPAPVRDPELPPPPPASPPPDEPADSGAVINDAMPGVKIGRLAIARDDGRCVKITERQSRLLCALAAASPNPVGLDFICRKICDQVVPLADKAPLLSAMAGEINSKIERLGLFVKIVRGVGAALQQIEGEP